MLSGWQLEVRVIILVPVSQFPFEGGQNIWDVAEG